MYFNIDPLNLRSIELKINYLFRLKISIIIIFFVSTSFIYSQNYDSLNRNIGQINISNPKLSVPKLSLKTQKKDVNKFNPIKFGAVVGVTVSAVLFLHNIQRHAWWSGEREQFHIQNDWAFLGGGIDNKNHERSFFVDWYG